MRIGFVGVGAMGAAMAGHAARAGFAVTAFDTDAGALRAAATGGVQAASTLGEVAETAEVVVLMVASDDQSREVAGALLEHGMAPGAVIVVAGTNHPRTMIELARLADSFGVALVDAPVVYGLEGARRGELVSLCGGSAEAVERVRPLLMAWSRSVEHIGGPGTGQLAKTCNNMMHWAACVANYEVLALARSCGLDAQEMRETLLKCPARNTTLERWDTTRFTWHEKDMDVALELAQQAGLSLPLFGAVDQLVKRLGPDRVRELLNGEAAEYLGQPIASRPLDEVAQR